MKGKVKFFNREKRFGFIGGEDDKEYFVHESGIAGGSIREDDDVVFDVEDGDRGPKAINVKKDSGSSESSDSSEDSDDSMDSNDSMDSEDSNESEDSNDSDSEDSNESEDNEFKEAA